MAKPIVKSFYSVKVYPSKTFITDLYLCFNRCYMIDRYIDTISGEIRVGGIREFDLDFETLKFELSKFNWWNARREKNAN